MRFQYRHFVSPYGAYDSPKDYVEMEFREEGRENANRNPK